VETPRTEGDRIPLMLIHGAWLSANSWENFAKYFESRGFAVSGGGTRPPALAVSSSNLLVGLLARRSRRTGGFCLGP
jgi:pimeloyl-ACP methyl ester carboxylesterase